MNRYLLNLPNLSYMISISNISFLFSCNNFKLLEFLFTSQNIDLINESGKLETLKIVGRRVVGGSKNV
mgnify:CR=1 FL=1